MPGCRHHARVSPSLTVSAARKEKPTTKRRKAHRPCPEDRQGTTLVLVARHEILMFPFERIRDVDRPARQEQAVLLRHSWLDMAESELGVLGSLDPRVRKLLGSSSKKAGPAGQSPRGSGERNHRGKPGLHRCE
jgi:hypothetical protein